MVVKTKLFPKAAPILKWCGGKRWLVPHLKSLIADFDLDADCYLVDLFAGGLSIPLGLVDIFGDRVIANDLNPYLVNLYNRIQVDTFNRYGLEYGNNAADFCCARSRFNANIQAGEVYTTEMAGLFYYLSKTSFNGLCRFAKGTGNYNTPFGRYKSIDYDRDLIPFQETIEHWQFSRLDFEKVPIPEHSLIYADPPYYGKDVFTGYAPQPFDWPEQVRLANFLAAQPGIKIASNYPDPEIIDLYRGLGFDIATINSSSSISANSAGRGARLEMLAIKVD